MKRRIFSLAGAHSPTIDLASRQAVHTSKQINGGWVRTTVTAFRRFAGIITTQGAERVHHANLFLRVTEGESLERSFLAFQALQDGRALLESRPQALPS